MRPPASEPENRTHGAKKIGPSQYSDFFNKIGQKETSARRDYFLSRCLCTLATR